MGNGQRFDLVATVRDALSGNVLSGARAPVPVYGVKVVLLLLLALVDSCGNVGSSSISVTVIAIVNSPYYVSPPRSAPLQW